MKHCPEFLVVASKLLPLLRRYRPFAQMRFDDLCDHLGWYWNRDTISYVIDDEPRAVCLIKLFRRLEQFLDPYVHIPCGKFVMLELMVADDPIAMGQICEQLTERFGPQEIVLWDRGTRTEGGAPRMYTWNSFMKLARRVSYGTIEMERI
jgi:hypothetical protein